MPDCATRHWTEGRVRKASGARYGTAADLICRRIYLVRRRRLGGLISFIISVPASKRMEDVTLLFCRGIVLSYVKDMY